MAGLVQVKKAEAMAASISNKSTDTSTGHLEAAMKKLDMDNYDNDDGNLITQILQVSKQRA